MAAHYNPTRFAGRRACPYRVRKHHISLFVSRSPDAERAPSVSSLRGFAVVSWVDDGLLHGAVSDVDPRDLRRFADLMAPQPR